MTRLPGRYKWCRPVNGHVIMKDAPRAPKSLSGELMTVPWTKRSKTDFLLMNADVSAMYRHPYGQ